MIILFLSASTYSYGRVSHARTDRISQCSYRGQYSLDQLMLSDAGTTKTSRSRFTPSLMSFRCARTVRQTYLDLKDPGTRSMVPCWATSFGKFGLCSLRSH